MASVQTTFIIGTSFLFALVILVGGTAIFSTTNATVLHYITPGTFLGVIANVYGSITGLVGLGLAFLIGVVDFPNPFRIFAALFGAMIPLVLGVFTDIYGVISPNTNTFIILFFLTIQGIYAIFGLIDWWGSKSRF